VGLARTDEQRLRVDFDNAILRPGNLHGQ
jgi:hypothetical protein